MTTDQANDIIENCLKAHWPNWDFKGQELVVWVQDLRKFDYDRAESAIDELYKSWDGKRYPTMAQIMGAIRRSKNTVGSEMAALYEIRRPDGRLRWKPFWGPVDTPREVIERDASMKLESANRGKVKGHYIQFLASVKQ